MVEKIGMTARIVLTELPINSFVNASKDRSATVISDKITPPIIRELLTVLLDANIQATPPNSQSNHIKCPSPQQTLPTIHNHR
jgi:hypothetical protein